MILPDYRNRIKHVSSRIWHALPVGGYPVHLNEKYSPFFIIGSGRSGNTLLRKLIMSKSMAYIPPETYVLGEVIDIFRKNNKLAWNDIVYLVLAQFENHLNFKDFGIDNLNNFAPRILDADPGNRSLAHIINNLYLYFGEYVDIEFTCWGDKTPYNTFFLKNINKLFPHAKYIFIKRDGCDVVASYIKAGIYNNIDDAAHRWVSANQKAMEFQIKYSSKVISISYEDLVRNTEDTLNNIIDFINIPNREYIDDTDLINKMGDVNLHSHHERVLQPIDTSSIGKGRDSLDINERKRLSKVMDKTLVKLDYKRCMG